MKTTICLSVLGLVLGCAETEKKQPRQADSLAASPIAGATLTVSLSGFHNDKGQAVVSLFDQGKGFPVDHTKGALQVKGPIKDGKALLTFKDLRGGTYALSVFHDENSDGKMNTTFIGMPTEGVGASRNPPKGLGPPGFGAAKFIIDTKEAKQSIRVFYP
jgi:uncharacterized protein (DUF2141 family)